MPRISALTPPTTEVAMEQTEQHTLTVLAASRYLGLSPSTLAKWRMKGCGPRYVKAGARVLYEKHDLDAWLQSKKRSHTADDALS